MCPHKKWFHECTLAFHYTLLNGDFEITYVNAIHLFIYNMYYVQQNNKKKRNTHIYFNTNYCTEMKLVQIIMDYCLLQFDALKFILRVRLHGGFLFNFYFIKVNPQIFQRNCKIHHSNSLETNFHNISNIISRVITHRNYS